MNFPKILFLGQKPVGETAFDRLLLRHGRDLEIVGVMTNSSAHTWWGSCGIWDRCNNLSIDRIDNADRGNDLLRQLIENRGVDAIISVQHPWILPSDILARVSYSLNFHNAALPGYQGHNCCNHAILNGDAVYKTTVHHISANVDAGEIAYEASVDIARDETAHTLYIKSNAKSLELFDYTIEQIAAGKELPRKKQIGTERFFRRDSLEAYRKIENPSDMNADSAVSRALYFPPFEPAYFIDDGKKKYVLPKLRVDKGRWETVFGHPIPEAILQNQDYGDA